MKLILSSCDFRNDNARKTIIDNLSKPISQCKLLYIPNEKATFETIHSDRYYLRMEEFGFLKNNVYVFDYYNSDEFLNLDIDVLYISGGNTFATLDRLRNCNFGDCNEKIGKASSFWTIIGPVSLQVPPFNSHPEAFGTNS